MYVCSSCCQCHCDVSKCQYGRKMNPALQICINKSAHTISENMRLEKTRFWLFDKALTNTYKSIKYSRLTITRSCVFKILNWNTAPLGLQFYSKCNYNWKLRITEPLGTLEWLVIDSLVVHGHFWATVPFLVHPTIPNELTD